MKYEITKGSEKDFEGAPEWATMKCHCTIGAPSEISNENVAFSDGVVRGSRWMGVYEDGLEGVICREEQWHIIAERRPITEPVVNQQLTTEWSAEGLPPVGVRCEFIRAIHWYVVEILYISGYHVVVKGEDGAEQCYQTSACQFRPIRSPEDVARDEAAEAMRYVVLTSNQSLTCYESIYDAIAAGRIPGVTLSGK